MPVSHFIPDSPFINLSAQSTAVAWSLGKAAKLFVVHVVSFTSHKIVFWLHVAWRGESSKRTSDSSYRLTTFVFLIFFCWYFHSFDNFVSMKFLIAVFLPASPFIPTSLFINFGDFYQPSCILFWPNFARSSVSVVIVFPFFRSRFC